MFGSEVTDIHCEMCSPSCNRYRPQIPMCLLAVCEARKHCQSLVPFTVLDIKSDTCHRTNTNTGSGFLSSGLCPWVFGLVFYSVSKQRSAFFLRALTL